MQAIAFSLAMNRTGYNLFAIGSEGLALREVLNHYLTSQAQSEAAPADFCYVNDFSKPLTPNFLRLPTGRGGRLKEAMKDFINDVRATLKSALTSEAYRTATHSVEETAGRKQAAKIKDVQSEAAEHGLILLQTPMGFALAPEKDGEVLSNEEFEKLPGDEKDAKRTKIEELQKKLQQAVAPIPGINRRGAQGTRQSQRENGQKRHRPLHRKTQAGVFRHAVGSKIPERS